MTSSSLRQPTGSGTKGCGGKRGQSTRHSGAAPAWTQGPEPLLWSPSLPTSQSPLCLRKARISVVPAVLLCHTPKSSQDEKPTQQVRPHRPLGWEEALHKSHTSPLQKTPVLPPPTAHRPSLWLSPSCHLPGQAMAEGPIPKFCESSFTEREAKSLTLTQHLPLPTAPLLQSCLPTRPWLPTCSFQHHPLQNVARSLMVSPLPGLPGHTRGSVTRLSPGPPPDAEPLPGRSHQPLQ